MLAVDSWFIINMNYYNKHEWLPGWMVSELIIKEFFMCVSVLLVCLCVCACVCVSVLVLVCVPL